MDAHESEAWSKKALQGASDALDGSAGLRQIITIVSFDSNDTSLASGGRDAASVSREAIIDTLFTHLKLALEDAGIEISTFLMRAPSDSHLN
jgi:hypothetical protein